VVNSSKEEAMSDRLITRLGGCAGVAYVVFALVGNGISGSSPDLTASRVEIARWAARQHSSAASYAGGYLELLGLLALIVFAGTAYGIFRRAEGGSGALSTTMLGAGLVSAAVKLASVGPAFAVYWRAHEGMSPQLTAALIDGNNVSFILTGAIDAVMLAAAALVILRTRVLARWLGWLAAAAAVLLLVWAPVANHAPPLGMLLGFVWFVAAGITLAVGRRAVPAAEPALSFSL
jgi:hypothetical protein